MDLDAYIDAHRGQWQELESLVSRGRLSVAETDRMIELYERVGTHLSVIRSTSPDPDVVIGLSNLLAKARRRAGAGRSMVWADLLHFFTRSFPAALYAARWWWIITGVAFVVLATIVGWWIVENPHLLELLGTPEELKQLVEHDFEDYYSSDPAQDFAFRLMLNNSWVAAQCIAFGVIGLPVITILINNALNIGLMAAVMISHGRADLFFGLILPHGLLELTAIFVAGGVGLRLFWSWVSPGPRTRMANMAATGRASVGVVLGLIVVLGVSALVEAFVTPSPLPTFMRIAVGIVVWLAFLFYALVIGRAAWRAGHTGDLDAHDRGEDVIAVD